MTEQSDYRWTYDQVMQMTCHRRGCEVGAAGVIDLDTDPFPACWEHMQEAEVEK